jgi:hypothetical protein
VSNVVLVYKDGLKEWKFKLLPFSFQIKAKFSINDLTQVKHNNNNNNNLTKLNITKLENKTLINNTYKYKKTYKEQIDIKLIKKTIKKPKLLKAYNEINRKNQKEK